MQSMILKFIKSNLYNWPIWFSLTHSCVQFCIYLVTPEQWRHNASILINIDDEYTSDYRGISWSDNLHVSKSFVNDLSN